MQSLYGTVNLEKTDDNAGSSEHDTSFFSAEGESSDHAPATSSLTEPLLADSDNKRKGRATDYLNEDVVADIRHTEQDASNVAASAEPLDAQSQAVEVPTTPEAADEESQPAIKARVARGPWTAYTETTDLNMPAPQAHTQAQAEAQQSASEAQTETSQPTPAASEASGPLFEQSVRLPSEVDIMTSGPLPSIPGFEDLVGWVADNPQDIGAHMALASAYAQSQDIDSALRIYRRIIKKPTTSETMLRMIWDDLSDLSLHAQHLPRYHQLSGDILLRLGRHREAIEAYNRLQSKDGD
jgi:tetratricopeptide (TPR) repeat protein